MQNKLKKYSFSGNLLIINKINNNNNQIKSLFQDKNYKIKQVGDVKQALHLLKQQSFDVVLLNTPTVTTETFELLTFFKSNDLFNYKVFHSIPVIILSSFSNPEITARCIETGAEDLLKHPVNKRLLKARVSACIRKSHVLMEEKIATQTLLSTNKQLEMALEDAAQFVRSLLPKPLIHTPINQEDSQFVIDWRLIPCHFLGGDAFGYHWLDQDHLAIYLLDVCGHGIGSALLSLSILNALRKETLADTNYHDPSSVLSSLNLKYPMQDHNNKPFTLWYGVLNKNERLLQYSGGGHPPPVFINHEVSPELKELKYKGAIVAGIPNMVFSCESIRIESPGTLYIFSDGLYEVEKNGEYLDYAQFLEILQIRNADRSSLDEIIQHVKDIAEINSFVDDVSIIEIRFT